MLVHEKPGTISTIAGNGEPAHAGDGGPAMLASLNEPKTVAVGDPDTLFIADSENHVIRRIALSTGIIRTVAGVPGVPAGVEAQEPPRGISASDLRDEDPLGDLEHEAQGKFAQLADISGTVRFVVGSIPGAGRFHGDGGLAAQAHLNFPSAIAVGPRGHLYIADTMNHRIRKVDVETGLIETIAGTGQHRFSGDGGPAVSAALNEPTALALDGRGCLYIADQSNNRVRRVDLHTGLISTVAGNGEAAYTGDDVPASQAGLAGPSGLALGPDDTLYIADTFNGRIRGVDLTTGLISTVAGDGAEYRYQGDADEQSTALARPYGIAVNRDGDIFITDSDNHLIRKWDRKKKVILLVAGNGTAQFEGDGGQPQASSLNYPFGVAVDERGDIYVADTFNHRIRKIVM